MPLTTVRAGAYLHHIALGSPDPQAIAAFYGDVMDMDVSPIDGGLLCSAPGRRVIAMNGKAKSLAYAGFAVRDAEGLAEIRARADVEGVGIETSPTPLFGPEAFGVRDPDDNLIVFGLARPDAAGRRGLRGPIQHLTLATSDPNAYEAFYHGKLGFAVSDRVVREDGVVTTCFMRSNNEHHTLACFKSEATGIDHHSYEAGEWDTIRDWADRVSERGVQIMWGPGRHGPGNNLFIFIEDPDRNWIEISAELEVIHDRPVKEWPHHPRTLNKWGKAIMRV